MPKFLVFVWCASLFSADAWDFVVVGGGVSGCVAADFLSATGRQTLLLESGPPGHAAHGGKDVPDEFVQYESANGRNLTRFDIPGQYHSIAWKLDQYKQPSTSWTYQANVLGGGGVINGALTMAPPRTDFDDLHDINWNFDHVNHHIKQIEAFMTAVNVPSADGLRYLEFASLILRKAFLALNFTARPLNAEPENRVNTYNYPPVAALEGHRISTCSLFLGHALARPNFKLITDAVVDKIVMGDVVGQAISVSFTRRGFSAPVVINLAPRGRVVLTAGALNTPRILMLSGIGPKSELEKLEIAGLAPPRSRWVLNEHVGGSLSDHVYLRMRFSLKGYRNFNFFRDNASAPFLQKYFQTLSGPLAQFGPVLTGYLKSPFAGNTCDIEVFMEPSDECADGASCSAETFDVLLMLLTPQSKTSLELRLFGEGTEGIHQPKVEIRPKNWNELYLGHTRDKQAFRWGIERMVTAMMDAHGSDLKLIIPSEATPRAYDDLLNSYIDSHMIGNHWAETCALNRCVDPYTMAVKGTSNVHVADASIMPHQISSHPMLTVAAMARRATEQLLVNSGIAQCAEHLACQKQGLVGQCCPSFDGVMLACCAVTAVTADEMMVV